MANFYGTTSLDIFFGPNQLNDYYFEWGELQPTDFVFGGTGIDTIHFVEDPVGGQIILDSDFDYVTSVEFIYLPDTSNSIVLSNSLATSASSGTAIDLTVRGGDHNDEIDASLVTSSVPLLLEGEEGDDIIFGGGGDSIYTGGIGDDDFTLSSGIETVDAGGDDDHIAGDAADLDGDTIDGGSGIDDLILTSAGTFAFSMIGIESVLLVSAANNVTIASDAYVGGEDVTVHVEGGAFADTITVDPGLAGPYGASSENYFIEANGGVDILAGGRGNDTLDGGAQGDSLAGHDGDDTLIGGTGGDIMSGGAGNDRFIGAESGDLLLESAGGGTDTIETAQATYTMPVYFEILEYTSSAAASITGNSSGNTITGGGGGDSIWGRGGNDTLRGLEGGDTLRGENGEDTLYGDDGDDVLEGGNHKDTLIGGEDDDTLSGGGGDDTLRGDHGADRINGGSGIDTVSYETATAGYATGVDLDLMRAADQAITGGGTDQLAGIENVTGSYGSDTMRGDGQDNLLRGLAGADTLDGRDGADTLHGGENDDLYLPGSGDDTIVEYLNQGFDTVDYSAYSAPYAAGLYAIYGLTGTGSFATSFDAGSDQLSYSVEAIITGSGNDSLYYWPEAHGGAGDDTFNASNAVNSFHGDDGIDTVRYFDALGSSTLRVDLENSADNQNAATGDTLESIENITYLGTDTASLYGDGADNRLQTAGTYCESFGRGGDDTLVPLAATDYYDGGEGIDTADYSLAAAAITLTPVGTAITGGAGAAYGDSIVNVETLKGSAFGDTMTVGDTGFTLFGQGGADTLTSGLGADTLDGGAGGDVLNGGGGTDTASYLTATAGVTVNLTAGVGSGGDAQDDTYTDIEWATGGGFADTLIGSALSNVLSGGGGGDTIQGWGADDTLNGEAGTDSLDGGVGTDILTGGSEADNFVFAHQAHSVVGALSDQVVDFLQTDLDKIDVSLVDAMANTAGNNAFTQFLGAAVFTAEGQIRAYQSGANTVIEFNTAGTTGADMQVQLNNFTAANLTLADFIL